MRLTAILIFLLAVGSLLAQQGGESDSLKVRLQKLEKQVQKLQKQAEQQELEQLKREASSYQPQQNEGSEKVFKTGQRSLQALNPELSLTGDIYGLSWLKNKPDDGMREGAHFRVLGLHFQSTLDPFSYTKVALEFLEEEIEVGELYAVWTNLIPHSSIMLGKFRQQFGVINRWHSHALDQFEFPLAVSSMLGEEGLNQIGASFEITLPRLWAHSNILTLEITDARNEELFGNERTAFGSILAHLKNYYDLNASTYLEWGVTGLIGPNDGRDIWKSDFFTQMGGFDLTLLWEPVNRAQYRSVTWRSELYALKKQIPADKDITSFGGYTYLDTKVSRRTHLGMRYDYAMPVEPDNDKLNIQQLSPYVTFWQSPWVRWRLQYSYTFGNTIPVKPSGLILQITWSAGPHKHERY